MTALMVDAGGQLTVVEFDAVPDFSGSCMVAFVPANPQAFALAGVEGQQGLEGALAPEDLHVTCCYLGDVGDAGVMWPEKATEIQRLLVEVAAQLPLLPAKVCGAGTLGDEGAVVLFLESEELVAVQKMLEEVLDGMDAYDPEATRYPSYVPHMTLGYEEGPGELLQAAQQFLGQELVIGALRFEIGEDVVDYPLAGQAAEAPPTPDEELDEMTVATFASARTLKKGATVTWLLPDGTAVTGVVIEKVPASGEPGALDMALVQPEGFDSPEDAMLLPVDLLKVGGEGAAPAAEEEQPPTTAAAVTIGGQTFHLPGKHNQRSHGHGATGAPAKTAQNGPHPVPPGGFGSPRELAGTDGWEAQGHESLGGVTKAGPNGMTGKVVLLHDPLNPSRPKGIMGSVSSPGEPPTGEVAQLLGPGATTTRFRSRKDFTTPREAADWVDAQLASGGPIRVQNEGA